MLRSLQLLEIRFWIKVSTSLYLKYIVQLQFNVTLISSSNYVKGSKHIIPQYHIQYPLTTIFNIQYSISNFIFLFSISTDNNTQYSIFNIKLQFLIFNINWQQYSIINIQYLMFTDNNALSSTLQNIFPLANYELEGGGGRCTIAPCQFYFFETSIQFDSSAT